MELGAMVSLDRIYRINGINFEFLVLDVELLYDSALQSPIQLTCHILETEDTETISLSLLFKSF